MNIYQGYKILISFSVCEIHDSEKVFDLTTRKSTSSQQQGYRKTCLPKVFTFIINVKTFGNLMQISHTLAK